MLLIDLIESESIGKAYYKFSFEQGVTGITAQTRLLCTKRSAGSGGCIEEQRKTSSYNPEDNKGTRKNKTDRKQSKQIFGGLYATFPPVVPFRNNGVIPHHTFFCGNIRSGIFDPNNTNKFSYGDIVYVNKTDKKENNHAILFVYSSDFRYDISGKKIQSGYIELFIFAKLKEKSREIYELAQKGDLDTLLNDMREKSIEDTPAGHAFYKLCKLKGISYTK